MFKLRQTTGLNLLQLSHCRGGREWERGRGRECEKVRYNLVWNAANCDHERKRDRRVSASGD